MRYTRRILQLALFLFIHIQLSAGIKVTLDSQGEEEISYYQDQKSAVWIDGEITSFSDAKTGMVYQFNHIEQVYSYTKIDALAATMQSIADQQMEEAKSSPFFQQMLDYQQAEASKHTWSTKHTGTQSIAGYEADIFEISKDDEVVKTMWVSKSLWKQINKIFPAQTYASAFQEGEKIFRELMGNDPEWAAEAEIEAKGMVVYESEKDMFFGEDEVLTKLISVETTDIDASRFLIPSDYSEVDFETFLQLEEESDEDWDDEEDEW